MPSGTEEESLLLSWLEPEGGDTYAVKMTERLGESWGPVRDIFEGDRLFVNWADFPSVYQVSGDTYVAHWLHMKGEASYEYDIQISHSLDRGFSWSQPISPHRDNVIAEHGFLSFFVFPSGSLGMVWLDGRNTKFAPEARGSDSGDMALFATTLSGGRELGPEVLLDGRVCECCPTSALTLGKTTLVAYRDRSAEEVRNIQIVSHADGFWGNPVTVHDDGWKIPGCPVNGPALAGEDDVLSVAWFTAPGGDAQVNVAFSFDHGATFGEPVRVDGGYPLGRVDLEWIQDSALVSWVELSGDTGRVMVRTVSTDGRLSSERIVGTIDPERGSGIPRMVRLGDWVYVAWTFQDTPTGLVIKRFQLSMH
ncbi:MAG: exo-alpha-sialidase [Candidatus Neomarinimicrobiota bacterium]